VPRRACDALSCTNGAQCVDQRCYCAPGFTGDDCSVELCPNLCSGNGACRGGKCVCSAYWDGDDCSRPSCARGDAGVSASFLVQLYGPRSCATRKWKSATSVGARCKAP